MCLIHFISILKISISSLRRRIRIGEDQRRRQSEKKKKRCEKSEKLKIISSFFSRFLIFQITPHSTSTLTDETRVWNGRKKFNKRRISTSSSSFDFSYNVLLLQERDMKTANGVIWKTFISIMCRWVSKFSRF